MEPKSPKSHSYVVPVEPDLNAEHIEYLRKVPGLKNLLSGFVSAVAVRKPTDIHEFAQDYFFDKNKNKNLPRPLVISGPSGVGKGTLVKMLLQKFPDVFQMSVSYTTRKPRQGEEHGKHYFFSSAEDFSNEIAADAFIEFTEVHGNYYGTHRSYVRKVMEAGKVCILEIDVVGAQKVSRSGQEAHYVWIDPPSVDELRKRLVGRGTEKEETVNLRMTNAIVELEMSRQFEIYEKFLINDELEKSFEELMNVIKDFYPQLKLDTFSI